MLVCTLQPLPGGRVKITAGAGAQWSVPWPLPAPPDKNQLGAFDPKDERIDPDLTRVLIRMHAKHHAKRGPFSDLARVLNMKLNSLLKTVADDASNVVLSKVYSITPALLSAALDAKAARSTKSGRSEESGASSSPASAAPSAGGGSVTQSRCLKKRRREPRTCSFSGSPPSKTQQKKIDRESLADAMVEAVYHTFSKVYRSFEVQYPAVALSEYYRIHHDFWLRSVGEAVEVSCPLGAAIAMTPKPPSRRSGAEALIKVAIKKLHMPPTYVKQIEFWARFCMRTRLTDSKVKVKNGFWNKEKLLADLLNETPLTKKFTAQQIKSELDKIAPERLDPLTEHGNGVAVCELDDLDVWKDKCTDLPFNGREKNLHVVTYPTQDGNLRSRWVYYGQPHNETVRYKGKEYTYLQTWRPLHVVYNGFIRPSNLAQWPLATDCKGRVWFRPDLYAQYFTADEMGRAYRAPDVQPVELTDTREAWVAHQNLTADQTAFVELVMRSPNGLVGLTGGAGVGKTRALGVAIGCLEPDATLCLSFTGKAAARSKEMLNILGIACNDLVGGGPLTIHSALTLCSREPNTVRNVTTIVLDEASMISDYLIGCLVSAVWCVNCSDIRWVVAGDWAQLPPIGFGRFLDCVHRALGPRRCIELTEVLRTNNPTGRSIAIEMNKIRSYVLNRTRDLEPFVESDGVKFTPRDVVARTSLADRAIQFMRDCGGPSKVTIAATYKNDACHEINVKAVAAFNPQARPRSEKFDPRPGDRVVCTKNTRKPKSLIITVSNGELGTVTSINSYARHKDQCEEGHILGHIFCDSDELIGATTDIVSVTMDIGSQVCHFTERRFESSFLWAYALTIHKVQGSEWTNVFYHPSECYYQTGRASYTGGTRPSKHLVIDADPETFHRTVLDDCSRDRTDERDSWLYDRITHDTAHRARKRNRYQ
jgi:hypothetical protein